MKKYILIIVLVMLVILTGCMKKISYTDIAQNVKNISDEEDMETEFVFDAGKISYNLNIDTTVKKHSNKIEKKEEKKDKYKSLPEFYNDVVAIKTKSDSYMEFLNNQQIYKKDIKEAIASNKTLYAEINKIQIPVKLLKSPGGEYTARKFGQDDLEALINVRIELLEKMQRSINQNSDALQWEIKNLKEVIIPSKEAQFAFAGGSMMEEEGFVWDDDLGEYVIK